MGNLHPGHRCVIKIRNHDECLKSSRKVFFVATDCASNDLEQLSVVAIARGATQHLDFPTPLQAPADGPHSPFCVAADVYNTSSDATTIYITLVGSVG